MSKWLIGRKVIREYEGKPESREVLIIYLIDGKWIYANRQGRGNAHPQCWDLNGNPADTPNPMCRGAGTLRHLRDGELEEMKREREERERLSREADELAEQFAGDDDYCGGDDLEGLAALAVKYRAALRKIAEDGIIFPARKRNRTPDEIRRDDVLNEYKTVQHLRKLAREALE